MTPSITHPGAMDSYPRRPIRIVALDDHPLLIEGMGAVLARDDTIPTHWLGSAGNLTDFKQLLSDVRRQGPPDIALIDLHLPDGASVEDTVTELVAHGVRCIVVTSEVRPIPLRLAVQAGAQALVLKGESAEHFADVVRRVSDGEDLVTSDIADALLDDHDLAVHLTPREREIMQHLADGLPRKLIGKVTGPGITQATVTTHINHVLTKYRAQGRAQGNVIELLFEIRKDGHISDST